jgi:hypothetical protein
MSTWLLGFGPAKRAVDCLQFAQVGRSSSLVTLPDRLVAACRWRIGGLCCGLGQRRGCRGLRRIGRHHHSSSHRQQHACTCHSARLDAQRVTSQGSSHRSTKVTIVVIHRTPPSHRPLCRGSPDGRSTSFYIARYNATTYNHIQPINATTCNH